MNNKNPIEVSPSARRELTKLVRDWTGWPDAKLVITDDMTGEVSPIAMTNHLTRTVTVNIEKTLLNPHRVLHTVSGFSLRQEAVLTGTLLHEAGHARFTQWVPRTPEARALLRAGDGRKVSDELLEFARLFEEPRVEAYMAAHLGTPNSLAWTMRASAAHHIPTTPENLTGQDETMLAFLRSWVLRAGRHVALSVTTPGYAEPGWVSRFNEALTDAMEQHLAAMGGDDPQGDAAFVMGLLRKLVSWSGHNTPPLIPAKYVLDTLFPNGLPHTAQGMLSCASEEAGGSPESGEQGEGGASAPTAPASPGEGDSGEGDSGEGDSGEGDSGAGDSGNATTAAMAAALRSAEAEADAEAASEKRAEDKATAKNREIDEALPTGGPSPRVGVDQPNPGRWVTPSPEDRTTQAEANRFLRDLIEPTEVTSVSLSESPGSQVDPAALAAWRASGGVRSPRFFRQSTRSVRPAPPVQVAVLVDVSYSMGPMQEPSSKLSWALANAALDLRNFAGRGVQVESCLIHWGVNVEVLQAPGQTLPGVQVRPCNTQTTAMHLALHKVSELMPGFFTGDKDGRPSNRLLVNFTDWKLGAGTEEYVAPFMQVGRMNGMNSLSVMPPPSKSFGFDLRPGIMSRVPAGAPGKDVAVILRPGGDTSAVWSTAEALLRG